MMNPLSIFAAPTCSSWLFCGFATWNSGKNVHLMCCSLNCLHPSPFIMAVHPNNWQKCDFGEKPLKRSNQLRNETGLTISFQKASMNRCSNKERYVDQINGSSFTSQYFFWSERKNCCLECGPKFRCTQLLCWCTWEKELGAAVQPVNQVSPEACELTVKQSNWNETFCVLLFKEDAQEEFGWKLVHGDVFRPPRKGMLLSVFLGSGTQIFIMTFVTLCMFLFSIFSILIISLNKPHHLELGH